MATKISIPLNKNQQLKLRKVMGGSCRTIEIDKEDLINVLKYIPAPVLIDFDEEQQKILRKALPANKCNIGIIDGKELCNVLRYMPPATGVVRYMPPPGGSVKYMPPPIIVKYMPPAARRTPLKK